MAREKTQKELDAIKMFDDEALESVGSIINTVREPLIVLDHDLRVVTASRSFYTVFRVEPEETVGQLIYDLGNKQWNIPKLRELLETILPQKTTFDDYEVEHDFTTIGRRVMLLNARQVKRAWGKDRIILLAIEDITERKRLEDLLAESEERYRRVFETASDGIVFLEKREGKITHLNRASETLLGYTKKESIGNKLQDIGVSLNMENFQATMQTLNRNGIINYNDVHVETKSGQHIDTDIYLVDRAKSVQCNIRDITDRKRSESEIQDLARFPSENPNPVLRIARDGTLLYINKSGLSMLPEWHLQIGQAVPSILHEAALQAIDSGSIRVLNLEHGQRKFSFTVGPVVADGYANLYGDDITERKQLEEGLRESENKFRDLVEKSIVGVFLIQDQVFKYVNARFAEIHGYTVEEFIDKNVLDTILPEDIPKILDSIQKESKGGEYTKKIHRIVTKQEGIKIIQVFSNKTIYQGKPAIIGTILDITEQKRDEETLMDFFSDLEKKNTELENTYDELRASQQKIIQQEKMASIGQLAAGIAHEINNPVGFVMSNLHSMGKYSERLFQFIKIQSEAVEKLSEQDRDIAAVLDGLHKKRRTLKIDYVTNDLRNVIKESLEGAQRVKRIVQDLMGFSRKDESVHKLADINDGMESTINVVWNELKYKANVKREYGKIPLTKCNIGQLNQVFMNLLINAVHAIEEHGEILIKTEHRDGDIAVSVSDTGCGISEDRLNRIFEPFFTTKEVGKGTGLGLSVAYDIVKKHNGEILVTSEIGKGSTFTITIPVVED